MEHQLSATLELRDRFTTKITSASSRLKDFSQATKKVDRNLSATQTYLNSSGRKFKNLGVKAARASREIRTASGRIKESVKGLKTSLGGIGGMMTIGATGYFLKGALDSYAELEDQVRRNKAIMGASAVEEAKLMEQTKKLGRETKFTAKEVAEAQMYQAMAGMKVNEVLELTPKLLKLSIASGEDLARTSDIITDNLDAFGLTLKDSSRFMDVMAAAANNSNTTISMLGEAFAKVASTSKRFDSMEEVTTILGILANNGIKGGIVGRNLNAVYSRLSRNLKDVNEAFAKVGVKLYDQNGKFRGLRKILYESKDALSKMTDEQKNNWYAMVGGDAGMKILASIMDYSTESAKKLTKAITNSTGATNKFAAEMSTDTKNKMAEFRSAIDGLKTSIGEGLAPVAIDFMNKWSRQINAMTDSRAFSTENMTNFFDTASTRIKQLGILWGGYKFSALAAANPVLATLVATAGALAYLLKDSKDEHKATLIEINSGGKIDKKTAMKMVALEKEKPFLSEEEIKEREEEIKKSQEEYLKEKEKKRTPRLRNIRKNFLRDTRDFSATNKNTFDSQMKEIHNSAFNKSGDTNNINNSTVNNGDNSVKKIENHINLGGITINNEQDEQAFIKKLIDTLNTKMTITQ